MVICRECGAQVREGKAFCSNCGEAVNAARSEAKEQPPEFRDTVTMPPPSPRATQTPTNAVEQPRPLVHAQTAPPRPFVQAATPQPEGSSLAPPHAPERRGFFGRRAWLVVLLLLLLVVFGFLVLVLIVD